MTVEAQATPRPATDFGHLARLRGKSGAWFWLQCVLFDNGYQATRLHRAAHWFKRRRIPIFGACIWRLNLWLTGVDINPNARIGPGLVISHGVGLVVGGDVVIGANCLLHHGVTLGAPTSNRISHCPTLGDGVLVGAGATLIGRIEIGNGAAIGAGAVVTEDVPPDGSALAPAATVHPP